jgi:hypothetical protein
MYNLVFFKGNNNNIFYYFKGNISLLFTFSKAIACINAECIFYRVQ